MRGRVGYTEAAAPRRKPVLIEDVDHVYTGARKAARISDYASEDTDDLSRRSQKKDRKLLDDITTKLVNSSYQEPIKVRHSAARRRPPIVTPVGRKPGTPTPRRVGIRPVPSLSHSYRASSLPPRYVEEEVVTPYNFYEVPIPRRHHYYRRELGVDDGELYSYAPPPAPVAREVRARTAVKGGGGRPVVRRRPGSLPPPSSRSRVNQAEIEREVEDYLEQPIVRSSARLRRSASRDPDVDFYYKPSIQPRTRTGSLERARVLAATASVPVSLPIRRSSLSGPVDRMPGLDPYRPKQGTSGNNYDTGNNYGVGYGTAIAPYTAARVSKTPAAIGGLPPKAPAFRPEMSDTRKRIRDVICMTRRDPHYYS